MNVEKKVFAVAKEERRGARLVKFKICLKFLG